MPSLDYETRFIGAPLRDRSIPKRFFIQLCLGIELVNTDSISAS